MKHSKGASVNIKFPSYGPNLHLVKKLFVSFRAGRLIIIIILTLYLFIFLIFAALARFIYPFSFMSSD